MKALVVYDSVYGNTEKIARAIAGAFGDGAALHRASEMSQLDMASLGLLIIGSPTQGGRPTRPVQDFLERLPEAAVRGVSVAAFDTRLTSKVVRLFGYAAGRIARSLKGKGGNPVVPAEGFFVVGTKGPLVAGELERAAAWARSIPVREKQPPHPAP